MADPLLDELFDWLRIPSISTGGGDPADLARAAEWAAAKVRDAGGEAELVTIDGGNPLVVGELRASTGDDAPTVLIYGHYDVQGAEPLDLWTSPPFEPEVRDGRVFARGAADDKGNFLPLLHAACELAKAGELPVHVRVAVEGEEEAGGESISAWLAADERGADAAIVYDSGMAGPDLPAITVGLRGVVLLTFDVRAAQRDLHSGMYGGSALNSLHALHRALAQVLPDDAGRVRDELRVGIAPVADAERESWKALPSGDEALAAAGARPAYPGAGAEYVARNGSETAVDVDQIVAGDARTVIPAVTRCTVSIRLAPGQDPQAMGDELVRLLRAGLPDGAELDVVSSHSAQPALFGVDTPAIALAAAALERACGVAPAFVRSGGSIPIVADFGAKGIPTIVTGFVLPDDPFHAPNESFSLRGLELGYHSARELLIGLADLKSQ
ncbi:M20/M25/M40 family metallo-hydrolase [Baekduia sp.]|jgi:acetylornithine deacetylase/succinyl-diaminopimelate desuccinylase-like protein|uniref:M20/M25/M40 family metallo-hydrolase n=1 Tax=Baekduia sp. TaxID=2600305 RepID=UPI002E08A2A9|nr:M20/M25/M40 family metallo-hydrolase [Baekduia sp.]